MNFILYFKLFSTGAIVLGLELVASRILIPFFGVSLHVWSSILAVTLIALAIGYKFGGFLSNRLSSSHLILYFIGSGTLSSTWINFASYTYPQLLSKLATWDFVLGSITACIYILLVPLVIFSSLNSTLVAILNDPDRGRDKDKDHKSGSVFFISTIGSVIGVFVVTYFVLPNYSNFASYAILSCVSSSFSLVLALQMRTLSLTPKLIFGIVSTCMIFISGTNGFYGGFGPKSSTFEQSNSGHKWTVVSRVPSFYGNHTVVDVNAKNGIAWRALLTGGLVNNRVSEDGVSYSTFTHALEALSFSGDSPPQTALVLGLGVGVVAANLSKKGVAVDAVELDSAVVGIARSFFSFDDSNISIFIEDARTYVQGCSKKYDVVIIDLFNGDGIPAHLVSREFFEDVKECTSKGGAVVMNAFYGVENLRSKKALLKTIADVFQSVITFEAPAKTGAELTQGYLLARNTSENWDFSVNLKGEPVFVIKRLTPVFRNWAAYKSDHEFLRSTISIRDGSNDWLRLTNYIDTIYRKRLTKNIPWQVLLD